MARKAQVYVLLVSAFYGFVDKFTFSFCALLFVLSFLFKFVVLHVVQSNLTKLKWKQNHTVDKKTPVVDIQYNWRPDTVAHI